MNPIVLTYIFSDFENEISSTYKFRESVARCGYDLINVIEGKRYTGHPQIFNEIFNVIRELPHNQPVIYADGADTVFLRPMVVPTNHIAYSTEKAYWPPNEAVGGEERYNHKETPWCYINGGGYCGPAGLMTEYYYRFGALSYGAGKIPASVNAQKMQHDAYFAARAAGFPVLLDQQCVEFQTIAFDDQFQETGESEHFEIIDGKFHNKLTNTYPSNIHGNGRTPMGRIYELLI